MDNRSRRNTLKGLAAAAPVVWAKPIVNSVVLPAHAETSISAGCYAVMSDPDSLFWPGGVGPISQVPAYNDAACQDFGGNISDLAVAATPGEALSILPCGAVFEIPSPDLPPGLSFYACR